MLNVRTGLVALAAAATVAACGGGDESLTFAQFVGSAGGTWLVDDGTTPAFQQRRDCGAQGDEGCFISYKVIGTQSLFSSDLKISYSGNLPGCPGTPRNDGTVSGKRVALPGCFSGEYVTINELVSSDGNIQAYSDGAPPDLSVGVWGEVGGNRRFKFTGNGTGCELTTSTRIPVSVSLSPANLPLAILETTISALFIGNQLWRGAFEGMSGIRLTSGDGSLWLDRRDEFGEC